MCACCTLHILTPQNIRDGMPFAPTLLQTNKNYDPTCLDQMVTGNETWVYHYEPHRKPQNKAWMPKGWRSPQITRKYCSLKKLLYTVSFDIKGIVPPPPPQRKKGRKKGDAIKTKHDTDCAWWGEKCLQRGKIKHWGAWSQKPFMTIHLADHQPRLVQLKKCPTQENVQTLPHLLTSWQRVYLTTVHRKTWKLCQTLLNSWQCT